MFRKIAVFILIAFTILSLCSCKSEQEQRISYKNYPFCCNAKIEYGELIAEGKLTYRNSAGCTLELLSPNTFSGVIFEFDGEQITVHYKGISFPMSETSDQTYSAAKLIFSSISNAETQSQTQIKGNEILISGNVGSTQYQLRFDKKSGFLTSLYAKSIDFYVEFVDFEFLD